MKRILMIVLAVATGCVGAAVVVSARLSTRYAAQLAEQKAAWDAEKAVLEGARDKALGRSRTLAFPGAPALVAEGPVKSTPAEIVAKLRALKFAQGPRQSRNARQAIYCLEDLIAAGPAALPAIREFLAGNEDIDMEVAGPGQGRGNRGGVPNDFVLPPSLRFGLFDAVKQIGGTEAEKLLAELLGTTGRGVEVAWLARTLQEIAPNKYREVTLASARELLAHPLVSNSSSPLDRNERDTLFGVLVMFGDLGYAATAQEQLLRPDGQVDRSALKYLQQTMGAQSVSIAAQLYDDPRLTDPTRKEPLARVALAFAGADPQANTLYQKAINDMGLSKDQRRNLIEDLNQDGFADRRNPTPGDQRLIQNRLNMIDQLAPNAADQINAAAFQEAKKDLLKMLDQSKKAP